EDGRRVGLPDADGTHERVVPRRGGPSPDVVHLERPYLLGMAVHAAFRDVHGQALGLERRRCVRSRQRLRMVLHPEGGTDADDEGDGDEAEERHAEEQPVVLPEVERHRATSPVAGPDAVRGRIVQTFHANTRCERNINVPPTARHSQYGIMSVTEWMKGTPAIQLRPCIVPPTISAPL